MKNVLVFSISLTSHVSRKCSDFVMKILKSEEGYRDNPTSFEGFSAEIWTFYETSARIYLISTLRCERDTRLH